MVLPALSTSLSISVRRMQQSLQPSSICYTSPMRRLGVFLGGQNFFSCSALSNSAAASSSTPLMVTGNSATTYMASISIGMLVGETLLAWVGL
jgi:hypothetical protein